MAKRAAAPRKPTRARGRDAGFEVEDQTAAAEAGPRAALETGLVAVTFVALLVALVLAQIEMSASYGRGLF